MVKNVNRTTKEAIVSSSREVAESIESVDVIVPLRNEAPYISTLIRQIVSQTFRASRIFLVVAPSDDDTLGLCKRAAESDDRIVVLENPGRTAPHAMNAALPLVEADAWVRIDGHQQIPSNLFETLRTVMDQTGAACVGPLTDSVADPSNRTQYAIGLAMASRWGVGNARFRTGAGGSGEVDTVAYGLYRRSVTDRVGLFNTAMTRNQDDEYNTRLRRAGGRIWLTDQVAVQYYPRSSLRRLADQYRQYGHWRLVGTVVFCNQLRLRQLAPPALIATFLGAVLTGRRGKLTIPAILGTGYSAVLIAQIRDARSRGARWPSAVLSAVAVATMHWSYGAGFWQGMTTAAFKASSLRAQAKNGERVD